MTKQNVRIFGVRPFFIYLHPFMKGNSLNEKNLPYLYPPPPSLRVSLARSLSFSGVKEY